MGKIQKKWELHEVVDLNLLLSEYAQKQNLLGKAIHTKNQFYHKSGKHITRKKQHVLFPEIESPNPKESPNKGFEWTYQERCSGQEKTPAFLDRRNVTMKELYGIDQTKITCHFRLISTKEWELKTECIQLIRILKSHTVQFFQQ